MSGYKGFTEAQARAHKKYMESVATIQIRMTPERREEVKELAAAGGESLNTFINRAIAEALERQEASALPEQTPSPAAAEQAAPPTVSEPTAPPAAPVPPTPPKIEDLLTEQQLSRLKRYARDYRILDAEGRPDLRSAMGRMVEKFGEAAALSDSVDTWTQTLLRASSLLIHQAESAERDRRARPEAIRQLADLGNNVAWVACFLNKEFNYEENRPNLVQPAYEFRRSPDGRLLVKVQKREYEK